MKKIILIVLIFAVLLLNGCGDGTEIDVLSDELRENAFIVVSYDMVRVPYLIPDMFITTMYHKDTNVMYVMTVSGSRYVIDFEIMIDENGNPLLHK